MDEICIKNDDKEREKNAHENKESENYENSINNKEENALQKELNSFKKKETEKNKKRKLKFSDIYNSPGVFVICLILSAVVGGLTSGLVVQEFFRSYYKNSNFSDVDPETNADFGSQEIPRFSISSIAERNIKSIAYINVDSTLNAGNSKNYTQNVGCSGIVVSEDGYILTNGQIISGSGEIHVNIGGETHLAEVAGTDSDFDITLLKINKSGLKPVAFGDSDTLKLGETVVALGNPLGNVGGSVTQGIISALSRELTINNKTLNLVQIDRTINPSSSGGGIFNLQGELIGMAIYKKSSAYSEGVGFAIPVNSLKKPLTDLKEFGYIRGRIDIEMKVSDLNLFKSSNLYKNYNTGVIVTNVPENSNAQAAGFQKGDCIISINSAEVSDSNAFRSILRNYTAGDTVNVGVQRGEEYLNLNLQLAEKK